MAPLKTGHYVILVVDQCRVGPCQVKSGQYLRDGVSYFFDSDMPEFFHESCRKSHEGRLAEQIAANQVRLCPIFAEV